MFAHAPAITLEMIELHRKTMNTEEEAEKKPTKKK